MARIPNAAPAGFSIPAAPIRSRYGKAIVGMYSDLVDCWPCDDAIGSTSIRNLVAGRSALGSFFHMGATGSGVFPGRPSVLANDPKGRCLHLMGGGVYNAAAYTMPAAGTLELLVSTPAMPNGDGAIFGNWNGSGIAFLQVAADGGGTVRIYKDGTFTIVQLLAVDFTPTMHWALTWDGTTQRFYVNGTLRASQSVGSPAAGGYVGVGVYSSVNHSVSGRFQWLAIYGRALAPAEVAAHASLVEQPA